MKVKYEVDEAWKMSNSESFQLENKGCGRQIRPHQPINSSKIRISSR
jgi:hypothetical protein